MRLQELSTILPGDVRWLRIAQPSDLATDTSFYERTCLPCHHAYVVVAAAVARSLGSSRLAFGYAGYQSDWPEQTPLATARLAATLTDFGISLELPVSNLASRESAIEELRRHGLSTAALEQKCTRQVTNVALDADRLGVQIDLWEKAIRRSMQEIDRIPAAIIEEATLADFTRSLP